MRQIPIIKRIKMLSPLLFLSSASFSLWSPRLIIEWSSCWKARNLDITPTPSQRETSIPMAFQSPAMQPEGREGKTVLHTRAIWERSFRGDNDFARAEKTRPPARETLGGTGNPPVWVCLGALAANLALCCSHPSPSPSPSPPRNQPILPLQSPIRRIGWTKYDVSDRDYSSGGTAGCWVEPVNIMGIGFKSGTLFGAPRRETKTFIIRERARLFASRQASEANPRLSRRPPAKIKPETRPTLRRWEFSYRSETGWRWRLRWRSFVTITRHWSYRIIASSAKREP